MEKYLTLIFVKRKVGESVLADHLVNSLSALLNDLKKLLRIIQFTCFINLTSSKQLMKI